jgi:hypothetical protein
MLCYFRNEIVRMNTATAALDQPGDEGCAYGRGDANWQRWNRCFLPLLLSPKGPGFSPGRPDAACHGVFERKPVPDLIRDGYRFA